MALKTETIVKVRDEVAERSLCKYTVLIVHIGAFLPRLRYSCERSLQEAGLLNLASHWAGVNRCLFCRNSAPS